MDASSKHEYCLRYPQTNAAEVIFDIEGAEGGIVTRGMGVNDTLTGGSFKAIGGAVIPIGVVDITTGALDNTTGASVILF